MANQVVIGIFADEAAATAAVEKLKEVDKADGDLSLKAMAVLVMDENGNVVEHKMGKHTTGKGIVGGYVLGSIAVALTPVVGVGVAAWTVGGALVGRARHKNVGLSEQDLDRIHDEIWGGKAGVAVLVNDVNVPLVSAKLKDLGGEPEAFTVPDEVMEAAEQAEAEAPAGTTPA